MIKVNENELKNRDSLNKIIDLHDYDYYLKSIMFELGMQDNRPYQRKWWEWASLIAGLNKLNLLRKGNKCISVGAGTENPLFYIANREVETYCIDLYSDNSKWSGNAPADFITNPGNYAMIPTKPEYLKPMYMSGTELKFDDNTFDFAFSMSSIEHFGGHEMTKKSMEEIKRVLKPNGIACIVTELILNDTTHYEFLRKEEIEKYILIEGLELIEPIDWRIRQDYDCFDMDKPDDWNTKHHIYVRWAGCEFTSIILWFKKR